MAGFTSYDDLINEMTTNGKAVSWDFFKVSSTPEAAGVWHSLWTATGTPGAGATPATTPGTAYTNTPGSIYFSDTSPDQKHIVTFGAMSSASMNLMVYDRLVAVNQAISTTGDKTINSVTLPRYTSGQGVVPFVEYTVASSAAGQFSLSSYTNQDNTGARVGAAITPPAAAMNVGSMLWLPLEAGDSGVRSIEVLNVGVAATSATVNIVLCRPLAYLQLPLNTWAERDFVLQLSALPRVFDGASLGLAYLATAATTPTVWGQLRLAYG